MKLLEKSLEAPENPSDAITRHSWRNRQGRWVYADQDADFWLSQAKKWHSYPHFLIFSILSALETWEIIGNV